MENLRKYFLILILMGGSFTSRPALAGFWSACARAFNAAKTEITADAWSTDYRSGTYRKRYEYGSNANGKYKVLVEQEYRERDGWVEFRRSEPIHIRRGPNE